MAKFLGFEFNHFGNATLLYQVALIILFGTTTVVRSADVSELQVFSQLFTLLGFAFFNINSKRYAVTSIANSLLLVAMTVQWAILVNGFWDNCKSTRTGVFSVGWKPIEISATSVLRADYTVVSALVALGAVAGRASAIQALALSFFLTIFQTAFQKIGEELQINDNAGSVSVFLFGGIFGLTAASTIGAAAAPGLVGAHGKRSSGTGAFGLLGTLLLFIIFPVWATSSGIVATGTAAVPVKNAPLHVTLALAASVAGAYTASKSRSAEGTHFRAGHLQGAVLSGAITIAVAAPAINNAWGALLAGFGSSIIAVGISTVAAGKLNDSSNVLGSFVIPGFLSAIAAAIAAGSINVNSDVTTGFDVNTAYLFDREAKTQGGYQMAYAAIALPMAFISGALTGFILRLPMFNAKGAASFEDADEYSDVEACNAAAAEEIKTTQV